MHSAQVHLRVISGGRDGFHRRFVEAMSRVRVVYQPIVWSDRNDVFGYEALVRSSDPWLPGAEALFTAAEEADEVLELERRIRSMVADSIAALGPTQPVFVNVHPLALHDPELYDPNAPLSRHADRVVIELTVRTPLASIEGLGDKLAALRGLGFRIGLDDLDSGYAGLQAFAEANPDVVKFDMALIRGIDSQPVHAEILRAMIDICRDLGIRTVGVGVETEAERVELRALGCDLQQGFRFARPHWPLADVAW